MNVIDPSIGKKIDHQGVQSLHLEYKMKQGVLLASDPVRYGGFQELNGGSAFRGDEVCQDLGLLVQRDISPFYHIF